MSGELVAEFKTEAEAKEFNEQRWEAKAKGEILNPTYIIENPY